jgi:hypothetical protein
MDLYYYLNGQNEQKGPVQENELLKYGITKDTLVWKEGLNNWRAAGLIPELSRLFALRLATVAQMASSKNIPPPPRPAPKIQPYVERPEELKKEITKASFWKRFYLLWVGLLSFSVGVCFVPISHFLTMMTQGGGRNDIIGFMLFSVFMFGIGYTLALKIKKIKKILDKSRGME